MHPLRAGAQASLPPAGTRRRPCRAKLGGCALLAPAALAVAAVVVAILALTGGFSAAAPGRAATDPAPRAALMKSGWVPSGDISGGGGVDSFRCSPQTVTGSESTATLEADGDSGWLGQRGRAQLVGVV